MDKSRSFRTGTTGEADRTRAAGKCTGTIAMHVLQALSLCALLASQQLLAGTETTPNAAITIANGDFSSSANEGSVGGGVIGGSGSAMIGSGPWSAAWSGVAGLLAPPTIVIGGGEVRISGLAGLDVAGILNNEARLTQDSGIPWQANRRYTISADIDAGALIDTSTLTSGNAGIALATGDSSASRVGSTSGGAGLLTLVGGSIYRLSLEVVTGASVSGTIHPHLYSEPANLLSAGLLDTVKFDNVLVTTHLIDQVATTLVPANPGPYSGSVGQPVAPALGIRVLDALGDPIAGISVSFAVPASGASATVVPNPAVTDANGVAQVVTTANTIAGSYQITATVAGIPAPQVFDMTNLAGPAATLGAASGSGQSAVAGTGFAAPVGLQVTDEFGNPVSGAEVTFTSPATGASSTFNPNPAISDANGNVQTTVTANTIAGTYEVAATVAGIPDPMVFELTNLAGPAAAVGNLSGSGQGATTGTSFATPLALQVQDQYGNAVAGTAITFAAPASGASATLSPVTTNSGVDGYAATTATANAIAGAYAISVSVGGLGTVGSFSLTNMLDPSIGPTGQGEPNQNAAITTPFACSLLVQIVDGSGTPMPGLAVAFVAPASGASATLLRGANSGTSLQVDTDSNGFAWVDAQANAIEGSFTIGAQLLYSLAPPMQFNLRNLGPLDPIMSHGFDGLCLPFVGSVSFDGDLQ